MGFFTAWRARRGQRRVDEWHVFVRSIKGISVKQGLLGLVNRWWNAKLAYRHDSADNSWKDPEWALRDGFGDCEDFAIGKMQTLQRCGIASEKLRLIHVQTSQGAHMVLGYYRSGLDESPLVLDNLRPDIQPLDQIRDYHPVYSVNDEGIEADGRLTGNNSAKWDELQERLA